MAQIWDLVLSLSDGDRFTVRGRTFTFAAGRQVDGYADRVVIRAWNSSGRLVPVTLRASSKVALG